MIPKGRQRGPAASIDNEERTLMSDVVQWVLELTIKQGKHSGFEPLMREMVDSTLREDGTLAYEWYREGDVVHLYERYADSDATMVHLQNFGRDFADRFMVLFEVRRFTVYGPASEAVHDALAALGPSYLARVGGFAR